MANRHHHISVPMHAYSCVQTLLKTPFVSTGNDFYAQIGNAVCVPVVEEIMKRIVVALEVRA